MADDNFDSALQTRAAENEEDNLEAYYRSLLEQDELKAEKGEGDDASTRQRRKAYSERSTAGKVLHSIAEVPTSLALRGPRDAVQELIDGAGDLAKEALDWAYSPSEDVQWTDTRGNTHTLTAQDREKNFDELLGTISSKVSDYTTLPDLPEPVSTAGQMSEGVSQFVTGYLLLGGAARKTGVSAIQWLAKPNIAPALTRGALTDFLFFDGQDANLASLIEQYPALENPVTEYLATDKDTPELEGRLKNAVTGTVAGVASEAVFQGIKGIAKFRRARRAAQVKEAQEELRLREDLEKLSQASEEEQLKVFLGDPKNPVLQYADEFEVELQSRSDLVQPGPGKAYKMDPDARITSAEHVKKSRPDTEVIDPIKITPELQTARLNVELRKTADGTRIRSPLRFDTIVDKLAYMATRRGKGMTAKTKARAEEAKRLLNEAGWGDDQILRIRAVIDEEISAMKAGRENKTIRVQPVANRVFVDDVQDIYGGVPADVTASSLVRIPVGEKKSVYFNFARFNALGDVNDITQEIVNVMERRPDTKTWMQSTLEANDIDAISKVINVSKDKLLNDAETIALGQLFYASSLKMAQLAEIASRGGATKAQMFAFARHLELHRSIVNRDRAAGSAAGRTLAARKAQIRPEDMNIEGRLLEMQRQIGSIEGIDDIKMLADMVKRSVKNGDLVGLNKFLQDPWHTKTSNVIREFWVNSILSGVETLAINVASPAVIAANSMIERLGAAGVGRATDDAARVYAREVLPFAYGLWRSIPDAVSFATKAAMEGGTGRAWGTTLSNTTGELRQHVFRRHISSEYLMGPEPPFKWMGDALDVIGAALNLPYRINTMSDEFWKTTVYRAELHAQAYRMARNELEAGNLTRAGMSQRINDLVSTPPRGLVEDAIRKAEELTFTKDPGEIAKSVSRVANRLPGAWLVFPFIRTPTNIIKYGFSRTPFQLMSRKARERIARGGIEAQTELAKIGAGIVTLSLGVDLYLNGHITGRGPVDRQKRHNWLRQGHQPYSVKIGDKYYQFNRVDPFGLMLGIVADTGDILTHMTDADRDIAEDTLETMAATALGIGGSVVNKTYFSGIAGLSQAVLDPERYGEHWAARFAGSFVPMSSLHQDIAYAKDPELKQISDVLDGIWQKTFPVWGVGENLPAKRDLWGRDITIDRNYSAQWNALSPVDIAIAEAEPIDEEMKRRGFFFDMPDKVMYYRGEKIDLRESPEIYSRYLQLQGNDFIHPAFNMGLKDLLNSIVQGQHELSETYFQLSDGQDGTKRDFISRIITQYRTMAKEQLVAEYPQLYTAMDAAPDQLLEFAQ